MFMEVPTPGDNPGEDRFGCGVDGGLNRGGTPRLGGATLLRGFPFRGDQSKNEGERDESLNP